MQTEQRVDLRKMIARLECLDSTKIENDSELSDMFRAILNRGIVKPNSFLLYERAINLLSSVLFEDRNLKSSAKEIINRLVLAKNLIFFKKKSQVSTSELARYAAISHTYISRLEICQMSIPARGSLIKNLATALVVHPKELFPDYKGSTPELPPISCRNPLIRSILEELDGLDDSILKFLLDFIQKFKGIVRK